MRIRIITLVAFTIISQHTFCQDAEETRRDKRGTHTIFLGVGGSAPAFSLNYEHGFDLVQEKSRINGRIGFGVYDKELTLPIGVSFDVGRNSNYFRFSIEHSFDLATDYEISNTAIGIGYVRKPAKGFYLYISLMYLVFDAPVQVVFDSVKSTVWAGLGAGVSF